MNTCSDTLRRVGVICGCGPAPSAEQYLGRQVDTYLTDLLATITPDLLDEDGRLCLKVGNETLASVVRGLLEARGRTDVYVEVAAPAPQLTYPPERWTPEMAAAKEAAWDAQQPRHLSPYTKKQTPTTKARKAARRRAKAGRKASR